MGILRRFWRSRSRFFLGSREAKLADMLWWADGLGTALMTGSNDCCRKIVNEDLGMLGKEFVLCLEQRIQA